ncbi:cytochrome P450 [Aspergillus novoparasiticus]|uniref:Cytochrome P450 n=1 Tax=Aspergillus novoparasiticus TaxID=986946 RepID=A0A5N6EFZ6_9EURO|nr:cytochrome P450 [Aspergillus novoparasiticus]
MFPSLPNIAGRINTMATFLLPVAIGTIILLFLYGKYATNTLIPGPPTLPLIGNLHQLPSDDRRHVLAQWHKKHGPIISLKFGWSSVIILGNIAVTKELFGKRSLKYGSRPRMVMARDCMTKRMQTSTLPWGETWKIHNRIQLSLVGGPKIRSYQSLLDIESCKVLYQLLSTESLVTCFNRFKFNIIYTLAYGKDPDQNESDFHEILELADHFTQTLTNATWVVDLFPILNCLPRRLAPWKAVGDDFHRRAMGWFQRNSEAAVKSNSWNWTKHVQFNEDTGNLSVSEMQYLIGVLFEAGVDSTATVLHFFVLACTLYPDAVTKARQELDKVVGSARLPTPQDLPQLPYVKAFIQEVLRWRPITAEGLPHFTLEDDKYLGYDIPKGSTVIFNYWSGHMDEDTYLDADRFCPERWIEHPDLPLGVFGYGRRACAGRRLALMSLETLIPKLLWAFEFKSPAGTDHEKSRDPGTEHQGALIKPRSFPVSWQLVSNDRRFIIERLFQDRDKDLDTVLNDIGKAFERY